MDKQLKDHMETIERNEEIRVPSWRLKEEADRRRRAEARVIELEQQVRELQAALKASREEWVFRRPTRGAAEILRNEAEQIAKNPRQSAIE